MPLEARHPETKFNFTFNKPALHLTHMRPYRKGLIATDNLQNTAENIKDRIYFFYLWRK